MWPGFLQRGLRGQKGQNDLIGMLKHLLQGTLTDVQTCQTAERMKRMSDGKEMLTIRAIRCS
jgi:hypothetical protein